MTIHHAVLRKAEKMGVSISEDKETDTFDAHWVEKNVHTFGVGGFGKAAMDQMTAVATIYEKLGSEFRIKNDINDKFLIRVYNADLSRTLDREPLLPVDALIALDQQGDKEWFTTTVPDDGAQAYKEGWTAGDNPYRDTQTEIDALEEGDDEVNALAEKADGWDAAFDEAADAAQEAEDEDAGGSVVKPEYRARYAEAGHPNHCGDWLADTLNNLILGKTHTDLDNFEALCNLNGVSLSKYKREGNGWQGRLRMTGRNLLARAIYNADGLLKLPEALQFEVEGAKVTELRATPEWLGNQRYTKPKAAPAAEGPIDQPATEDSAPGERPGITE